MFDDAEAIRKLPGVGYVAAHPENIRVHVEKKTWFTRMHGTA